MASPQKEKALSELHSIINTLKSSGKNTLPTENELISMLNVSRNTVRSAVSDLVKEGFIEKIQGKGTFLRNENEKLIFTNWVDAEDPVAGIIGMYTESFNRVLPNTFIANESIPYTLYVKKILHHFMNNEAADVMQITPFWLQRFKHLEALTSLSDYTLGPLIQNQYQEALELQQVDEEIFSINWTLNPQVLYYNKQVMKESGLDPENPPSTMDDFDSMCRQIENNNKEDVHGLCLPLDSYAYNYLQLYPFLLAFGGGFCDEIGNLTIDSKENVEALTWLSSLYRSTGATNTRNINDGRNLFSQNKVGFLLDGPYCRGHLRRLSGKGKSFDSNYGIALIPEGKSGKRESILITHSLAISKHCRKPDTAFELINHICTDQETNRHYFEEFGMIPANRNELQSPFYTEDKFASVLLKQLQSVTTGPLTHPLFIKSLPFLLQIMPEIIIKGEDPAEKLAFLKAVITIIGKDKTMIYL